MKTLKDLKTKLMKNDEFRRIYESRKPLIDFVNDIIELRYEKGWTQKDLAEFVGTAKSNISRIEKGKQNISYEMMKRLTEALGGKLLITARGDRFVKLTEEAKKALNELVRITGKEPEYILEESLKLYKELLKNIPEKADLIRKYLNLEEKDLLNRAIKVGIDNWYEKITSEFKLDFSFGEVAEEWQESLV